MHHAVTWTAPAPLWPAAPGAPQPAAAPALLRFAHDDFMDDLLALLERNPGKIAEHLAAWETWAQPMGSVRPELSQREAQPLRLKNLVRQGLAARAMKVARAVRTAPTESTKAPVFAAPPPATHRLKLYQPAQMRHYVVGASLVCQTSGLPDRAVHAGQQERVGYVVRRLAQHDAQATPAMQVDEQGRYDGALWRELAYVAGDGGMAWQVLPEGSMGRLDGEEFTPLFPLATVQADGRRRRLLGAVVPVAKREAYVGAPVPADVNPFADATGKPAPDSRLAAFRAKVTEPWKRLLERADRAARVDSDSAGGGLPATALEASHQAQREQLQTISWYVLLDFAQLLQTHLNEVWQAIAHGTPIPAAHTAAAGLKSQIDRANLSSDLRSALQTGLTTTPATATNLSQALRAIRGGTTLDSRSAEAIEQGLEQVETDYQRAAPGAQWPRFLFPLADPQWGAPLPDIGDGQGVSLSGRVVKLEEFEASLDAALVESGPPPKLQPPDPSVALRQIDPREPWFVIRFVYERPECAGVVGPVLSAPTLPFQMAGFFDPDAPARPIRIGLPIDPTPAGLRKFDRNTAFVMSDLLCRQVQRMKGLGLGDLIRSVLPWPLHKDLEVGEAKACHGSNLDFGMVCSLSIPIITICALILLMIMVTLLDLVFRWLPYFIICLPLPGLKAKKGGGS